MYEVVVPLLSNPKIAAATYNAKRVKNGISFLGTLHRNRQWFVKTVKDKIKTNETIKDFQMNEHVAVNANYERLHRQWRYVLAAR